MVGLVVGGMDGFPKEKTLDLGLKGWVWFKAGTIVHLLAPRPCYSTSFRGKLASACLGCVSAHHVEAVLQLCQPWPKQATFDAPWTTPEG